MPGILSLEQRWTDRRELIDQIVDTLRGSNSPRNPDTGHWDYEMVVERLYAVEALLEAENEKNGRDVFDIYGPEEQLRVPFGKPKRLHDSDTGITLERYAAPVPKIDLAGIDFRGRNLDDCALPWVDLKGARFDGASIKRCYFYAANCELVLMTDVVLDGSNFELADCTAARFDGARCVEGWFKGTTLNGATFENKYKRDPQSNRLLKVPTIIYDSTFLKCEMYGTLFDSTNIYRSKFAECQFGKWDDKNNLIVSIMEEENNNDVKIDNDTISFNRLDNNIQKLRLKDNTTFKNISYNKTLTGRWYDILFKPYRKDLSIWYKMKRHGFTRWDYTNFQQQELYGNKANISSDLERFINDQRYINSFRERHPFTSKIWWVTSDFGYSWLRLILVALFVIWGFGLMYASLPLGEVWDWLPAPIKQTVLYQENMQEYSAKEFSWNESVQVSKSPRSPVLIKAATQGKGIGIEKTERIVPVKTNNHANFFSSCNPPLIASERTNGILLIDKEMSYIQSNNWKWFFVSADIFTNLGIQPTKPLHPIGVCLMMIENLLGILSLGMLISVLGNRFGQRSR